MQRNSTSGVTRVAYLSVAMAMLLAAAVTLGLLAKPASASFGLAGFDGQATANDAGDVYSQAGGHPYALSTEIEFNHHADPDFAEEFAPNDLAPDAPVKDVFTELPAGLIGNPGSVSKCTADELAKLEDEEYRFSEWCPLASQVGFVTVSTAGVPFTVPLFSLVAPSNVPARFGFNLLGVPVALDASVRSSGDYGLNVDARNISEAIPLISITLTIWGVPADPVHDADRCYGVGYYGIFVTSSPFCTGPAGDLVNGPNSAGRPLVPFMTQPTRCTAPDVGLETKVKVDSWNEPGVFQTESFLLHEPPNFPLPPEERGGPVGITGCDVVPFDPNIEVTPTVSSPDTPTGLDVSLSIPTDGLENPSGIAQSNLKKAVVQLPEGMAVNPSAADGLGACSLGQIALDSTGDASCPDNSKIGTVQIDTPLLEAPLSGSIYLAKQNENPFGSLLAVYVVAKGPGVVIKLAGRIDADPVTGRLTTTFDNAPQIPFATFKLSFKGGPRAPLVTPATCGAKTITSELTGWSGKTVTQSESYTVDCPAGLGGFFPGFAAGTTNPQAGGFSPFTMTLSRADGQQAFGSIKLQLPPGLLGILKSVPLCAEAQAATGMCGAESLVGHTTVAAGAGSNPFYLGGSVYLTGPYAGAPFGLSIVVPAVAGPFNLGNVVVRAKIEVDPHTAQLTITSDPLPTILQGIPLDLRVVNVAVSRDGFTFNPTDCEALSVGGTVTSSTGTSVEASNRFQAANCAALPFAPKLSAAGPAKTSRNNGAALDVKVAYPSGAQANIHSVAVILPKQLPARLSTIQQACPAATFEANPASCGEGSMVGVGTASTPVFAHPLTGPAYLVSHGGESFPDIVVILQGEGVTIQLVGNVFINKAGITSATFAHIPDAPISGFDLNLPEGPHSALSAVGSLCAGPLTMPTTITGQNGAVVKQATPIKISGCPKAKKKHKVRKHKKKRKAKKGSLRTRR